MNAGRLILEGVSKRWPDGSTALDAVDLVVEAGETLVLLGSSGAGKTTLLRVLAGLERLDAGSVTLGERTLSAGVRSGGLHVAPEQRGIGVVFQALELWPQMTVAEHIAFALPGRPRGAAAANHAHVRALAESVGLPANLLGRRPPTLSGGEQQRTAIARTLAAEPAVILYDEPLANLDPDRRQSMRTLIRALARAHGTTLVYVTHDPSEALELGHQVAVMAAGRVVECGAPMALYAAPTTLLGAQALGPISVLSGLRSGGRVVTALGTYDRAGPDGPCDVLWRPESLRMASGDGTPVLVTEALARGPDYAFVGELEGQTLRGVAAAAPPVGETCPVVADEPVAVLARSALAVKESA